MNKLMVIGITGGIGAGKSYVARLMQERFGIPTYDCDREAKRLNNESSEIRQALTELVGAEVYGTDGTLDRRVLANYLFASHEHAAQINAIVHPAVKKDFVRWKDTGTPIVALESAILFESGFDQLCDKTITVTAPLHLRIERACQRDSADPQAIQRRIRQQTTDAVRSARADFTLVNEGNDTELISNIEKIILNL